MSHITIDKPTETNNGGLPEGKKHHCWPPMINHRQFWPFRGPGDQGVWKSSDFYCKRHVLAWINVVWAILREDWLGGVTSRGEPEKRKSREAPIGMMIVSPLIQGLRYRAACDVHCRLFKNKNEPCKTKSKTNPWRTVWKWNSPPDEAVPADSHRRP